MNTTFLAFLSGICLLFSGIIHAENKVILPPVNSHSWELRKDGKIKVYVSGIKNSDFDGFKAVALLNAPIQNIMAVMTNPKSCVEWVENCITSYGFDATSFHDRYGYTSSHLPWPFKNRDLAVHIITNNDPATGIINIHMQAVNGKVPLNNDNVRIHIAETDYEFKKVDANHTLVIWRQHADPDGALPGWLVNALIVDIPLHSLRKLEKVANLPKYSGYTLEYSPNGILTGIKKH
jgi:hypothetical protein